MFDPIIAEIRFGCGLSPTITAPDSADQMLSGLLGPDDMAQLFPIETFPVFRLRMQERTRLRKDLRQARGTDAAPLVRKELQVLNKTARQDHFVWLAAHINRRVNSVTPLRERVEWFWSDHFTATGKAGVLRRATSPYVESAIRPHLSGLFEDLLISAVTHPLMVHYLDQEDSVGPNAARALRRPDKFGLNENLAREILELHTLGVNGPYSQTDVRQLAELLTGLTATPQNGRKFRKDSAEPGPETVLGVSYGGDQPHFRDIEAVLRDLARHPATARHLAQKLAVHFVSDAPDLALVASIEAAYLDSGGALPAMYQALLTHPSAWVWDQPNVKPPLDFIGSACRALAIPRDALGSLNEQRIRRRIFEPMTLMGHVWQKPNGPDGLDEADSAWVTPQGIAARLQWAIAVPRLLTNPLPDPRDFVDTALGGRAPEPVRFAARAAESRADGVGLVLASPAFQRM